MVKEARKLQRGSTMTFDEAKSLIEDRDLYNKQIAGDIKDILYRRPKKKHYKTSKRK